MEQNQKTSNERMGQDQTQNDQNKDSLNTAAGLRNELQRDQDETGSGRSYDYGTEGSSEEDTNEQLGRNSNQQTVSNPTATPGTGSDPLPGTGRSDSRAGMGSGLSTKQSITGSDFDGQNRQ